MKKERIYSLPLGLFEFVSVVLMIALVITLMILFSESIWLFLIALFMLSLMLFDLLYCKAFNSITITDKGVFNKKQFYSWDDVCITMFMPMYIVRKGAYSFAFYNRYFNVSEKKTVKRIDFFIVLTKKRVKKILQYYNKEINILETDWYAKHILRVVEEHNAKIKKGRHDLQRSNLGHGDGEASPKTKTNS